MHPIRVAILVLVSALVCFLAFGQFPSSQPPSEESVDTRLPNGRSQKNEILKADHAKNIEDARLLVKLSEELKADLEKNTEYVFSITALKKAEQIEKAAHRVRSRLKRY